MIGSPALALRLAAASVVFGGLALGALMLWGDAVRPDPATSMQVTMPNGETIRDVPDYWGMSEVLGGRAVEIPANLIPGSSEFMSGLQPSGSLRVQAGRPGTVSVMGGQYRIHRISGDLKSGTVQVEHIGN